MYEGDDEDLWISCLNTAYDVLEKSKPRPHTAAPYAAFATKLYAAAKAATAKDADAKPKSIVQLKQV